MKSKIQVAQEMKFSNTFSNLVIVKLPFSTIGLLLFKFALEGEDNHPSFLAI